ncbi:MAG: ArsS family sensor histidine kinase [Campylobacter sp.]|nr:ArsS family sensor histidine kinase [Campylobacter sp.]
MKRSSIFFTITFIFALAITAVFLAFLWLLDYDKQNYTRELNAKYSNVAQANLFYLSGLMDEEKYKEAMSKVDMPEVRDKKIKDTILNEAQILEEISDDIGSSAILLYNKHNYLKIQHIDTIKILMDKDFQPYRYDVIKFVFAVVAVILLLAYIFVIYKLKPLRKLKRQIVKFANGDLAGVVNTSSGKDEISEVAEAFYEAVLQIKTLNDSRHLFLRNIMHELKTPITKGRIVAEMMDNGRSKERLVSVFNKLESLINELAAIEQTTSKIELTNKAICYIDDIMDEAIDMAMIERKDVSINKLVDIKLEVEFKLFSTAIKNMIDNGLKYGARKYVNIVINKENIKFITEGEPLDHSLDYYIQPFIKGQNTQKSFGLGLYIVSNILNAHGMKLEYEYKNGLNIFIFNNLNAIITQ